MDYRNFDPGAAAEAAVEPTQKDLLTQVEADHFRAAEHDDHDAMAVLEDRKKVVAKAKDDEAARTAYRKHVTESAT